MNEKINIDPAKPGTEKTVLYLTIPRQELELVSPITWINPLIYCIIGRLDNLKIPYALYSPNNPKAFTDQFEVFKIIESEYITFDVTVKIVLRNS